MKQLLFILLSTIIISILGCQEKQNNNGYQNRDIIIDSISEIKSEWSNFLDSSQMSYPDMVKEILWSEKQKMKGVNNPMIATYLGSEFGDYFYFNFRGSGGKYFDFGRSKNNNISTIYDRKLFFNVSPFKKFIYNINNY